MNYIEDPDFRKYKGILREKHDQLRFFDASRAGVLFFDGKNATKHHDKDMIGCGFSQNMISSAKKILTRYKVREYYLYSYLDEITIIVPDICYLARKMEEDNADCLLSLFAIMFYESFSEYDNTRFKGCYYSIEKEQINDLLAFRRHSSAQTTLEYYFKEYCKDVHLQNRTYNNITKELIKRGLFEDYLLNTDFRHGLYVHYKENSNV